MRFMLLVKASDDSEAGVMPAEEELAEMGAFNEDLENAGVLLAGEGLHPSSKGVRVEFADGETSVTDGPFAETKELVAGFWMIQVDSLDDAVAWARKVPFKSGEIEVRQVFEADDFGEEFTPELREKEEQMRERLAKKE